jgi:hypothetical protein
MYIIHMYIILTYEDFIFYHNYGHQWIHPSMPIIVVKSETHPLMHTIVLKSKAHRCGKIKTHRFGKIHAKFKSDKKNS